MSIVRRVTRSCPTATARFALGATLTSCIGVPVCDATSDQLVPELDDIMTCPWAPAITTTAGAVGLTSTDSIVCPTLALTAPPMLVQFATLVHGAVRQT